MNPKPTMNHFTLPALTIALIFSAIFIFPVKVSAQVEKKPTKNQKTVQMKIVTTENGKTTVYDTTITTNEPGDTDALEYEMRIMEGNEMNFDTLIIEGEDSLQKRIIIHGGPGMGRGPCEGHLRMEEMCPGMPFDFSWNGFGDVDEDIFLSAPFPGQFESILGSIPMGAVKGFKIKEKKGGKRIIIDIDDDYPVMMMQNYNRRMAAPKVVRTPRTIIIEREEDVPPPPKAPEKPEPPKETSKPEKG
jgi:hypothetical protein